MNRTIRQKINKEIESLNNTIAQVDLADIWRNNKNRIHNTSLSSAHGPFSSIDHKGGHEESLGTLKVIRITQHIQSVLSDYNSMELQINNKKIHTYVEIKLTAKWPMDQIINWRKIRKYFGMKENKNTHTKTYSSA